MTRCSERALTITKLISKQEQQGHTKKLKTDYSLTKLTTKLFLL